MIKRRSKNENGFGAIGIVLIVVVLAAVGATGYIVYKKHHKTTPPSITTSTTKSLAPIPKNQTPVQSNNPYVGWKPYAATDSSYAIEYPSTWTVGQPFGCGMITCVSQVGFSPTTNSYVYIIEAKSSLTPQQWFAQNISPIPSESTDINSTPVNGYATYHDTIVDKAYTDEHYVLSNNGILLDIYFREISTTFKPDSSTIASQQNDSQYIPQFTKLVHSVKLN